MSGATNKPNAIRRKGAIKSHPVKVCLNLILLLFSYLNIFDSSNLSVCGASALSGGATNDYLELLLNFEALLLSVCNNL